MSNIQPSATFIKIQMIIYAIIELLFLINYIPLGLS